MWLLKAAIFFTLFAFALNNQQTVAVNLFFGTMWKAPLVLVVLATFAVGLVLGVVLMVPRWWKNRPINRRAAAWPDPSTATSQTYQPTQSAPATPTSPLLEPASIPRHGL